MKFSARANRKGAGLLSMVLPPLVATAVIGVLGAGCLSRPVVHQEPTTKTNFTADVKQSAVDKVDLLFAIDNSASMGDKQDLLKEAVPDLINRLVTPDCVNDDGTPVKDATNKPVKVTVNPMSGTASCAQGNPEFQPVHDLHIGIVTSSLGGRGGDQCPPEKMNPVTMTLNAHNDDHGHLINRGGADEHKVADAGTSNYLAWFPAFTNNMGHPDPAGTPKIVGPDPAQLVKDFQDLVSGVHEYGCGLENQLESWYHFLIQPDPYAQIIIDPNDPAKRRRKFDGIDKDILIQRKDFLRPDSLVAIILLTDEEDSGMDPVSVNGQGWAYVNAVFPGSCGGGPARGTSACDTPEGITTPNCTSCGFSFDSSNNPVKLADGSGFIKDDPNCQKVGDTCTDAMGVQKPQPGYYATAEDMLNTRTIRMKQRYGVDPQYPIRRYTDGLGGSATGPRVFNVPNTAGEHAGNGVYQVDNKNCRNPLFAKNLPIDGTPEQLCNLEPGPRTRELVFFAAITGVPWQLLTEDPTKPDSRFKASLNRDDWKKIVGNDPNKYDFTGIDPHMYEAIKPNDGPRAGLAPPTSTDMMDTFHGREWATANQDLQFACTFELPKKKNCADPMLANACDCIAGKTPPLCEGDPTLARMQTRGKAYPGIRQLTVARDLGDQGIAASLCARKTDAASQLTDPDYGYRPAVRSLIDRLKSQLTTQCVPQELTPSNCGDFPCLVLETLGTPGPQTECDKYAGAGLSQPSDLILKKFREQQRALQGPIGPDAGPGVDQTRRPVCQVKQLVPADTKPSAACVDLQKTNNLLYSTTFASNSSCATSNDPGWCYLSGPAAGRCPHTILFSMSGQPVADSTVSLVCIEASGGGSGTDGGK